MAEPSIPVRTSTLKLATELVAAYNREWITMALLIRSAAEALAELGDVERGLQIMRAFEAATGRIPAPEVEINMTENEVIAEWLDRF